MFTMKKAIAFMLAMIMVLSCVPFSLATDGDNRVTDTIQNPEVRLIPKEAETTAEGENPELPAADAEAAEEKELTCTLPGAQDVSLSDVIGELEITGEQEVSSFMQEIATVSVSNPETITLTETEGDWTIRATKEAEEPESVTICMQDGTEYNITAASEGTTEISTENNDLVISTVNDLYLPEEANAYAETLTEEQEEVAISAVQETASETDEQAAYQVLSIGMENVDEAEYEGFEVSVNLTENLKGKDFKLYQVQDGTATDITDTLQLNSETNENGLESVSGFSFTTDGSAEYVLSYTLETYYTAFDGTTFNIRVDYDEDSGIPSGAELQVREILQGGEEYDRYLSDSAEKLGVSSSDVTFARFFDIEIVKDGKKIEPSKPVQVKISYQDPLELAGNAQLSVVHFADEGTEVIRDVDVTADGTELTYEQESFSVTGTIVTGNPEAGRQYIVLVQDQSTGKYYAVQNSGSLVEVTSVNANTVTAEYPLIWTYRSINDGLDANSKNYKKYDDHPDWEPFNIRIALDARGYDWAQLPEGYYFRYISPASDTGINQEKTEGDHINAKWFNSLKYENNQIYGMTWDNAWVSNGKYIGADFERLHITGNNDQDHAAKVYLAKAEEVPAFIKDDRNSNREVVSHIDIAITGESLLDVPLAYGTYYDENGFPILTVSSGNNVTLHLKQDVDITKEDIMKASVKAYDKNGNELQDAFYITGYSSNQQTSHSAVQVRMEGSFKVDTLEPYPYNGVSNNDATRKAERLQNQVYYNVSTTKDVDFDLIYEDQQLYDAEGQPLKVTAKVSLSAGFSYWDEDNECPPVLDDFEEKYSGLFPQGTPKGGNHSKWESGAILDNRDGFVGDSGMDFVLGNKDTNSTEVLAVEVVKLIEDESGTRIHPKKNITNSFTIYGNPGGNPNDVKELAVSPTSIQSSAINYSGYNEIRSHNLTVGQDGVGVLYDYHVDQGMYYITEDSSPMENDGANTVIIDREGKKWVYKETRTETEYVWRDNNYSGKIHVANGYSAVPEVLGDYKDVNNVDRRNQFLEFYVHNIYTQLGSLKINKIAKIGDVEASTLTDARKNFADGIYTFNVFSDSGAMEPATKADGTAIGNVTVEIENGSVKTVAEVTDLMPGTYYVKEIESSNSAVPVNTTIFSVEVVGGRTGNEVANNGIATVTNTMPVGNLEITKTLSSTTEEEMTQTPTYPITVSVELKGVTYYVQGNDGTLGLSAPTRSLTVTARTPLTISNLPYGTYTVAETDPGSVVIEHYSLVEAESTTSKSVAVNGNSTTAALTNVYIKDTSWTPEVDKLLNGANYDGDLFSFIITGRTGKGTYTETVSTSTEGKVSFSAIPYTLEDAGKKYRYIITEAEGTDANMAYDAAAIYAEVSVINENGTLKATATYYSDAGYTTVLNTPAFENNDLGQLDITKSVTGTYQTSENDEFPVTIIRGGKYVSAAVDGSTYTFADLSDDETIYYIHKDETLHFVNMPIGEYVVTETDATRNGHFVTTTYRVGNAATGTETPATVEVTKNQTTTVEIQNQYRSAELVITKTISGIDAATAGADIKISVVYGQNNVLLNGVKLTEAPFVLSGNVYTATLKNTDTAEYAQYIVPDGEYTVTETVTEPKGYGLKSSTYAVTAEETIAETTAVSGTGYTFHLTNTAASTGRIDYKNEYQTYKPEKNETELNGTERLPAYTGAGTLGAVEVGDMITYTISYKNYKSEPKNIIITDKLDDNVKFVDASDGGSDPGTEYGGTVIWTLTNVAADTEGTVTLTVKVLDSARKPGKVVNTASVQVGDDPAVNTQEVENPVPEPPHKQEIALNDITGLQSYTGNGVLGAVKVGDEITYEISYKNYKSNKAKVVITDKLDANVAYVKSTPEGLHTGWTSVDINGAERHQGGTVTWTFEDIPAGKEDTVTLTVKVLEGALESNQGNGKVVNGGDTAKVKVGDDKEFTLETVENPVPEGPHKIETAPYNQENNEALGAVKVGDEITYKINYRNYKSEKATVVIKDTLDPNVAFVSASDDGRNDAGVVTWTLSNVAAGAEGSVTLTVKVLESARKSDGSGKVVNGGDNTTVKIGNDSEFILEEVENPVPEEPHKRETGVTNAAGAPRDSDAYSGTGERGPVQVGDYITYEIEFKNYKTAPATIIIKDKLDPNVEFISATDLNGQPVQNPYSSQDRVVTWTLSDVPGKSGGRVTLTVRVLESALESVVNAETGEHGPGKVVNGGAGTTVKVGNDNEFTLETVENPVPEPPHKKEILPYEGTGVLGAVHVGDLITYEISYKNYKTVPAMIQIKDKLDANVEYVKASNSGSYNETEREVTWNLTRAAGAEGTVTVTVRVLEGALESKGGQGKVVNGGETATVQVGNDSKYTLETVENPVPDNPYKTETEVNGAAVTDTGAVKVGDVITYEIRYKNYKAEPADITIKDTLDEHVAFVSASNNGVCTGETTDANNVRSGGVVNWTIKDAPVGDGFVTLEVRVLDSALVSNHGPGEVVNGGNGATVRIGNDSEYTLNEVENPVPDVPYKKEILPYDGSGVLGAVKVGQEITYEIYYTNYNKSAATVTVIDTLDANVMLVDAGSGTHTGETNGGTVTWTISGVAAGTTGKVTLKVKVLESAKTCGKVINKATVEVGNDGAVETNEVENPVPDVPHKQEIALNGETGLADYTGDGDKGAVKVGDEITYRIDYKNYKTEAADVVIEDKLDPHVAYVSSDPAGVYSKTDEGQFVTWTIPNVSAGKEDHVTLKVKVLEGALVSKNGNGKVINGGETSTVKVGNDQEYSLETVRNPVPEAPHKEETAPYEGVGALGAVKVGEEITYKIVYNNTLNTDAEVSIVDTLDEHVKFKSATDGGTHSGEENGGTVTWNITASANQEISVTLTVEVLSTALESQNGPGKVINGGDTTTITVNNTTQYHVNTMVNPVPEEPHKQEIALNGKTGLDDYTGNGVKGAVKVGDQITYEIKYKNYKTEAADVVIKDTLDPHVKFVSADNSGAYSNTDHQVTWTIKDVAAGTEGTVTLTVEVLEGALVSTEDPDTHEHGPGKVVNGGTGSTVKVGNDKEFTLDEVENPVPEAPEKKETGATDSDGNPLKDNYSGTGVLGAVKVGDEITYTISYTNYKTAAATVTVIDTLDPNVEYLSSKSTAGGVLENGKVTWTIENVGAGKDGSVTLVVKVLEEALESNGGPGKVINGGKTATVKVENDQAYELNEVENPVPEEPQKRETSPGLGTGEQPAVKVGDQITYEILYKNYKNTQADVIIKDTLDANVELVESATSPSYNTTTSADSRTVVKWEIKDVPAGKEGKVILTVKVLDSALVTNQSGNPGPGKVVNGGTGSTVQVGNDQEFTLNEVTNPVPDNPRKQEIGLNGQNGPEGYEGIGVLGAVKVGDEITYEISYKNYKNKPADIVIKDKLDSHVSYVSASDDGAYIKASHRVTWTLANVPAGKEGHVTLTVKVEKGALESNGGPGYVVNGGDTATVKVGNDNEYTLNEVENPVPEVPHKQETSPYQGNGVLGGVKVGDKITYEISYRNYKAEKATVKISDKLDDHVKFVSASDNGIDPGTNAGGTVTWTLENVDPGKKGSVTLTVEVLPSAVMTGGVGTVVNNGDTATVQVDNDQKFTLDTVENPVPEEPMKREIALNGTTDLPDYTGAGIRGKVQVGDEITYEITYKNYKTEAADVTIKDKLDDNVEIVSASDSGAYVFADHSVVWMIPKVGAGVSGSVTLTVKVLKGALQVYSGPDKVINGGDTATVKVGNDNEYKLNEVENPVESTTPTGSLEISKAVFVDGTDKTAEYPDKSFHVKVAGEIEGNTFYVKDLNGQLSTIAAEAGVFEVKPGKATRIENLPEGKYTITEVKTDGTELSDGDDPGVMGSMTFLKDLSRISESVIVINSSTATAKAQLVNVYTSGRYCIAVTKQWKMNGEIYADDSLELKVKLQRSLDETNWEDVDGQKDILLNKDNNWSYVAVGMDQMDANGTRYAYRWVETDIPDGWEKGPAETVQSKTADGKVLIFLTKLTNVRTENETSVKVRKIWSDGEDAHKEDKVTMKLMKNGTEEVGEYELNAANEWTETVKNLPLNENGEKISYSWVETEMAGYRAEIIEEGNVTIITNVKIPSGTGKFSASKTWTGGSGTATLTLTGRTRKDDGTLETVYTDSKTVTGDETASWPDAPLFTEDGRPILYELTEKGVEADGTIGEYISTITGDEEHGYVVVNHAKPEPEKVEVITEAEPTVTEKIVYVTVKPDSPTPKIIYSGGGGGGTAATATPTPTPTPTLTPTPTPTPEPTPVPTVSVSVMKVWDDNNNFHQKRPESIHMTLSNGMTVVLNEANGWSATIKDLPAYTEDGTPIEYTWREQAAMDYTLVSVQKLGDCTVFTNRLWQRPEQPSQGRKPKVPGKEVYVFDDYDTPLGVQVVINHVGDCFD